MSDHAKQIRRALDDIVTHWDATLEPVRRGAGSHVKATREPPMPVSAHVLDVRAMCRSRMAGWCLLVIEERDLRTEGLSGLDVRAMADLLGRHAPWLAEHEAVEDVVAELEMSAREIKGLAMPQHREWMSLGKCPIEIDSEAGPVVCGGQVRAPEHKDPYCAKCGTEAVTSWWERAMFDDPELTRLLTAPELVAFIHKQFGRVVAEVTIRAWLAKGIITKAGSDTKGRSLYDKAAVAYSLERRKVLA